MPYRLPAASELAEFLRALAHPRRIQILEELGNGERDVASLAQATELAHSSVSQHLMVLRAHRVVLERREGRRVFWPELVGERAKRWKDSRTFSSPWIGISMSIRHCNGVSGGRSINTIMELGISVIDYENGRLYVVQAWELFEAHLMKSTYKPGEFAEALVNAEAHLMDGTCSKQLLVGERTNQVIIRRKSPCN